jgi:lysyl-tRNA synthetase class 2
MADDGRTTNGRDAHSSEGAIVDARRAKAERLRSRGENPFANDVKPRLGGKTCDVAMARAMAEPARDASGKYDESRVVALSGHGLLHVRGRVVVMRSAGGLSFLRLRDRTG